MKKKSQIGPAIRTPSGLAGPVESHGLTSPGVAGLLLLIHASLNLALFFIYEKQPLIPGSGLSSWVLRTVIMQGVLILLPSIFVILFSKLSPATVTGTEAAPGSFLLSFAVGIPAAVVFHGLNNLLVFALVRADIYLPETTTLLTTIGPGLLEQPIFSIILILFTAAVIPAIIEELFFRGIILPSLLSSGSVPAAIFWQAVAFSIFHGNVLFLLPPFLAGLLLASVRIHCGRLWPAMVTHLTLNISLVFLTPLLPQLTQSMVQDQSQHATSLLYASLIAACIAAVALIPIMVLIGALKSSILKTKKRLVLFPGDWKFALGLIILAISLILANKAV